MLKRLEPLSMKFREITSEDYNNCAENLVAAYAGAPWHNKWTKEEALLRIKATMSGFNSRGYVIENNDKILAMCIGRIDYYFSYMDQFYIDEFNVIPSHQGSGIGKQLINSVSNLMKNNEIHRIFLITGGKSAVKFYKKNGFIESNDGFMMELEL